MAKNLNYLYCDFETTKPNIPDEYDSPNKYYLECENPVFPEIYSWLVINHASDKKQIKKFNFTNTSDSKMFKNYEDNNENFKFNYDISGESFIEFIESIEYDSMMYFNNLKGFDGHFIIPLLDKAGYELVIPFDLENLNDLSTSIKEKYQSRLIRIKNEILSNTKHNEMYLKIKKDNKSRANNYLKNLIKLKWKKLLPYEYSLMTNGNFQIYQIKIGIPSTKTTKGIKKNRVLIIRDNLTLFPTSIKKMGETIASYEIKQNGMEPKIANKLFLKDEKKDNYLRSEKYKSLKEFQQDKTEFKYLVKDVFILYKFHKVVEKYFPRNLWKMTIGETSYKQWVHSFTDDLIKKMIENKKLEIKILKRGAKRYIYDKVEYTTEKFKEVLVKKFLPTDWLNSMYDENNSHFDVLYKYYGGGITHVNEIFRGQFTENLTYIDRHSSYPSAQITNEMIPYGIGIKGDVKTHPFKFYKLIPNKTITNKYGLPFLFNYNSSKREYLKVLKPNTVYYFTSITYERFKKYYSNKKSDYHLEVEYSFMQMPIKRFFESFIGKWYGIKEDSKKNGNKILETIAKLFLNSLYGKFGTKLERESKVWNQEIQQWESTIQTLDSKFYLPISICIAEIGRMALVDGVDNNYSKVLYCDTDSLVIKDFNINEFKNIELHESHLGTWGVEIEKCCGIFRRPKQYMLKWKNKKGEWETKYTFSGINFNKLTLDDEKLFDVEQVEEKFKEITFTDFLIGRKIPKQLQSVRVYGYGIILEDIEKQIKPVWEYKPLTEQIFSKPEHFQDSLLAIKNFQS